MDTDENKQETSRGLKTVDQSLDIIKKIEELDGARVVDLTNRLDISRSTIYKHLATLRDNNYIYKDDGEYQLSYQFLVLGEYVRNQSDLFNHAKVEIDRLAEGTKEYAHLTVEQNGLGINLYKASGENAVAGNFQQARLQKPDFLHYSSTGKSILAYLPKPRINSILDKYGLPERTDNTITDRVSLFEELDRVQERGYAYNDEESIQGIRAVGAPVRDGEGDVLGALSISGPTSRLKDEIFREDLPEKVIETANIIEVNIRTSKKSNDFPNL